MPNYHHATRLFTSCYYLSHASIGLHLIVLNLNDSTDDENSKQVNNRINRLDIPNGLKEILINHQFEVERLDDISAEDLSIALSIDDSVARIIIDAVKELHDEN